MANSSDGVESLSNAAPHLVAELQASRAREQKLIETERELRQQLISWIADYGALEAKQNVLQQGLDDMTVPYNREVLINTLVYHYRKDISGCGCGWADLGASHPKHVADVYEESVRALND